MFCCRIKGEPGRCVHVGPCMGFGVCAVQEAVENLVFSGHLHVSL